jgi:3-hydroxyacyl-CoA dehydrogenase
LKFEIQKNMNISKIVVIGAGTMGGGIAAHCANVGLDVTLLDMPAKAEAGDRNAIVRSLWERQLKARPAALYTPKHAERVRLGNTEDDFDAAIAQADWIIEVIVEQLEPKRALAARIDALRKPDAIVTSNTSGIPIGSIVEGRSDGFKAHFFGTHFFNPPRYLKLLEVIPHAGSDRALIDAFVAFAESRLGKSVVLCKDTPNFIANRIGAFVGQIRTYAAIDNGYTVEEVDVLTGPMIGNPKTGTFRLTDLVGLDVMTHVTGNLYELALNDESREFFKTPAIMQKLLDAKALGNKTGAGFYKTVQTASGKEFWSLDLNSGEYVAPSKPRFDVFAETREIELADRFKLIFDKFGEDRGGQYVIETTLHILAYAARRIPEIADLPSDIDAAMRLGFGSEMGPFQIWDAIGVKRGVELMREREIAVAPWVEAMLAQGVTSFYATTDGAVSGVHAPDPARPTAVVHRVLARPKAALVLRELAGTQRELKRNASAALFDLGDGVLGYAFHGKGNTIDQYVADIGNHALELLQQDRWRAMVIGNQGKDFCLGANIGIFLMAASDPKLMDSTLGVWQEWILNLRFAPKPIVSAVHQRALGGGAEMGLLASRMAVAAETYIGLVEFGVGVIPAFGGCKELLRRVVSPHITSDSVNALPYVQKVFETIAYAKVSESAAQARELGFLVKEDQIVLNDLNLLGAAKRIALEMADAGYTPPHREDKPIYALGKRGKAAMFTAVENLRWGGHISEYDAYMAKLLANVLSGGDLSAPQWVSEKHIMDLERAAFTEVVQQPKTQDRIAHVLKFGKPLRN